MGKHTPGPWRAWQLPHERGYEFWRISTPSNQYTDDILRGLCGAANAHLIASAPEMYDALEAARSALQACLPVMPVVTKDRVHPSGAARIAIKQAEDAIAAAKGGDPA